jgi:hypothetical protein
LLELERTNAMHVKSFFTPVCIALVAAAWGCGGAPENGEEGATAAPSGAVGAEQASPTDQAPKGAENVGKTEQKWIGYPGVGFGAYGYGYPGIGYGGYGYGTGYGSAYGYSTGSSCVNGFCTCY